MEKRTVKKIWNMKNMKKRKNFLQRASNQQVQASVYKAVCIVIIKSKGRYTWLTWLGKIFQIPTYFAWWGLPKFRKNYMY